MTDAHSPSGPQRRHLLKMGTAAAGLTVMESEPDGDAAAEIYALANEIKHKLI